MNETPTIQSAGRHFLAGRGGSLSAQIVADVRDALFEKRLKPGEVIGTEKDLAAHQGTGFSCTSMGEVLPRYENFVQPDRNVVDKWGIPVLKFHFKWSDHEWKQARHMEKTFTEIIETMGGRVVGLANAEREADGRKIVVHTQPGLSRKSIFAGKGSADVATNQMGDRSAREPKKVVPSRDITPGRRMEPLNRGLPNETSWPQGHSLRER